METYKKGDLLTVTIEDLDSDGQGIGKADGYTLFIKDALVGDVVIVWNPNVSTTDAAADASYSAYLMRRNWILRKIRCQIIWCVSEALRRKK